MRPREQTKTPQSDLFRLKLTNSIDLRHELCQLGERIDLQQLVGLQALLMCKQQLPNRYATLAHDTQ
jgi:hypothetical protein